MTIWRWMTAIFLLLVAAYCANQGAYWFWLAYLYSYPPNPPMQQLYLVWILGAFAAAAVLTAIAVAIPIRSYLKAKKATTKRETETK